jgi:hypothetical protein
MPKGQHLVPLHELVGGFSATDPSTGSALLQADVEKLSPAARQIRRHLVDALNASERPAILHPQAAYDVLRKRHVMPIRGKWNSYQLDRDRRTVRVPHHSGGTRNVLTVTTKFPTPDDLPALPERGSWLIIWHGDVDVLSIPGVSNRVARLRDQLPVSDVLFWSCEDDTPTLFSLLANKGLQAGRAAEFPDPDAVRDADPSIRINLPEGTR